MESGTIVANCYYFGNAGSGERLAREFAAAHLHRTEFAETEVPFEERA